MDRTLRGDVAKLFIEFSLGNMIVKEVANAIRREEIATKNLPKLILLLIGFALKITMILMLSI